MPLYQIIAAMVVAYIIGYGQGKSEGQVHILANAPITCSTENKVTTCK